MDKIGVKKTDFYENLKGIINSLKLLDNGKETNKYNEIKKYLDLLKKENIFDYKAKKDYLCIFRYLNDKTGENITYLLEKDVNTAKILEEKLDPMETTLTSDDLMFFVGCIKFIKDLYIPNSTDKEVFNKIQEKIGEDESESNLKAFKNYSKSVKSIKELENYSDEGNSILTQIKNNINIGVYSFYKNYDEYKNDNIEIKNGYDILYDLKCKIQYKINIREEKNNNIDEIRKEYIENLKNKNKIYQYFEEKVDYIRIIKFYVEPLRNKGCQIDLFIFVHFCYDENEKNGKKGKFYLGKIETSFLEIKQYLMDVNNFYTHLLTKYYKENDYIRFSYGK